MQRSKFLQRMLTAANQIFPKRNIVIFNSYPPYSDNALALYEYILANRPDIVDRYQLVWGQEKDSTPPDTLTKYKPKIIVKKTVHGILTFLSAKYIFTTHGYFPGVRSGNGQLQVNLWHGCGYKSITEMDSEYVGDINIVTGGTYVPIHEKVFHMKPGTVYPTGLPRNDILFQKTTALRKIGIEKESYHKIYIWMPTYRKAKIGHEEIDGTENGFTVASMNKAQIAAINQVLAERRDLLIVKPHPMDAEAFENVAGFGNVITITNEALLKCDVKLYELLPETDGLLSDYSSVVIDYLLLDKPIVMVMSDITAYESSRGFVFKDIKDYIPGPVISEFDGLMNYFRNADAFDSVWEPRRKALTKQFHDYQDNRSCERVCNLCFGSV